MTLTVPALALLDMLREREIPVSKCDFRPKVELLRAGFAKIENIMTNDRRRPDRGIFQQRCLCITDAGRAEHDRLTREATETVK